MRGLTMAAFAVIAVASARAQAAAQPAPNATLDRAIAAYAKVKTVRASFTQTITNPLLGRTFTSAGDVTQQRPGYLSVRFTQPANDRIVADGKYLWVYLPSSTPGQVIRMPVGKGGAGVPDVTAQFLESPRTRYDIADAGRATAAGRPARALKLTARDSSLPFTTATVWVDDADALVRQFEVTDGSGVTRRVTISKLAVNGAVSRSTFTFAPPKGVRVFDQGSP
ncbi:MAG: outer membrane lipoprotein chaperone LolA [Gemmatimonadaceae bacterium]